MLIIGILVNILTLYGASLDVQREGLGKEEVQMLSVPSK